MPNTRLVASVQKWNAAHAVGTQVRYWAGVREGAGKPGRTTSEAFLLAGHTPVVLIDTCRGCVALAHVQAIAEGQPTGEPKKIQCPRCRRVKDVSVYSDGGRYCHACQMEFDGDPDDGGDFDDRNPAARLERQEQRRAGR